MKILCIGDSNTFGYDPGSFLGSRYPAKIRWTERLGDHEVINSGMNGLTIPRDAAVFADLIRSKSPDLVVVMLGDNDLLEGANAETAAHRMESFISAVRETRKQILLIAPPPLQDGEWTRSTELIEESEKLGKLYRELAERTGVLFADADKWNVELTFDGVHFSAEGHALFAKGLTERLRNL